MACLDFNTWCLKCNGLSGVRLLKVKVNIYYDIKLNLLETSLLGFVGTQSGLHPPHVFSSREITNYWHRMCW